VSSATDIKIWTGSQWQSLKGADGKNGVEFATEPLKLDGTTISIDVSALGAITVGPSSSQVAPGLTIENGSVEQFNNAGQLHDAARIFFDHANSQGEAWITRYSDRLSINAEDFVSIGTGSDISKHLTVNSLGFVAVNVDAGTATQAALETKGKGSAPGAWIEADVGDALIVAGDADIRGNLWFNNDTGTGIASPAGDTVALYTGGTERLLIKADGVTEFSGSVAGIAGNATTQSFSVGREGTGIHGSSVYERLFVATGGVRRMLVNENGEISLGDFGPNAASLGSGVRIAPERTGTGTVRGTAFATQFDDVASDAQNVFVGGSIPAGTGSYTAVRIASPAIGPATNATGLFFESLDATTFSACIESHSNATTGAWLIYSSGTLPSYFAGQIQAGPDSAASPAYSHYGDTSTGTFSPAVGSWGVSCNGGLNFYVSNAENGNSVASYTAHGTGGTHSQTQFQVKSIDGLALSLGHSAGTFSSASSRMLNGGAGFIGSNTTDLVFATRKTGKTGKISFNIGSYDTNEERVHIDDSGTFTDRPIFVSSGTAEAPSLSYDSDPDTGTFSGDSNTWCVATGGVERLRVDSSGNVGIGTSTPASTLDVAGQVTADSSSASAVAYGFRGDTDTGLFSFSSGMVSISCNGLEVLRADESGDLQAFFSNTPKKPYSLVTKKYVDGLASLGNNIKVLTQSEYDNLATKDPNTLYCITG